jgi:hypothetical protein
MREWIFSRSTRSRFDWVAAGLLGFLYGAEAIGTLGLLIWCILVGILSVWGDNDA